MNGPEAQLQADIIEYARYAGWLVYHTHDSRRSNAGFPDLVLVSTRRRMVLYRELKRDTRPSRLTRDQLVWLHTLRAAGQNADVWTPADWPAHVIEDLRLLHPDEQRPLPPVPPLSPTTRKTRSTTPRSNRHA